MSPISPFMARSIFTVWLTYPSIAKTNKHNAQGFGGRALNYPRGKVLGGCSSINGMIYMRGQAADYNEGWAPALKGQGGWSWDEVLPYFVRGEDYHDTAAADGKLHGKGGEWRVERQRLSWEILDAFRDAAAEQGIPKVEDFNRGDNFGSRCEGKEKRGRK